MLTLANEVKDHLYASILQTNSPKKITAIKSCYLWGMTVTADFKLFIDSFIIHLFGTSNNAENLVGIHKLY